ncbi:universal stress protein [Parvularcula oceani]|uniref:universal stress protein n=1 Tax=Parvularcula oceani TaxID=1247963 RepID=UPI0004E1B09F|nr:universal stress protein [Parvularcula oceani]
MPNSFRGPVLAATDFTDEATMVLQRAFRLASRWECAVEAVHATDERDTAHAEAERRLRAEVERVGFGKDVRSCTSIVRGGPAALAAEAERLEARSVVLGFHKDRPGGTERLGSAMETLLHSVPNDVLVVGMRPVADYRRVLVLWDGEKPLMPALEAGRHYGPEAELAVLSAVPTDMKVAARRHEMRAALRTLQARDIATVVAAGTLVQVIREQAGPGDLAVLSTRGNVLGTVSYKAEALLSARVCDTLCLHAA